MGDLIELNKKKTFTFQEARNLLPIIKKITQEAVDQAEHETDLAAIVDRWSQKILKLGCEPKGLWLVDFDNSQGYFCWKYPEEELAYYHTYEGAFSGRTPIL